MRNELELMEKIERYLNDQLSAEEKLAFETEINSDPGLQEEVTLQREIKKGIERAIWKQQAKKAGKRFNGMRNFRSWGFGAVIILVITAAVFYFQSKENVQWSYHDKDLPELNEAGEAVWADADKNLSSQIFSLDASVDTVIETRSGIVLSVPANGFLDKNGQPVKGRMELVVKEALDPASIISAGLSTRAGDRLLETGGMFFLDARQNGKTLKINPANSIYADVPTDSVKPGMMLFSGSRMKDGSINWINPRPLEHSLVPVDIHSLNFYPPDYLDSLKSWGYNPGNKTFTDSLYFSLASIFGTSPPVQVERDIISDSSTSSNHTSEIDSIRCGINPAKIKAIWDNHYQNTLISTREFAERIRWIHNSADPRVLDLYVNNLDKDLSQIDSLAAGLLGAKGYNSFTKQFLLFASRHDGKVKNGSRAFDKLREYYKLKAAVFTKAIAKTQRDFWDKQAELDRVSDNKHSAHHMDSIKRMNKNIEEEFNLNLKEAWKQLGYDSTVNTGSWNRNVYTVQVTTTGWCNVDRYVMESVLNRVSLNYTDSQTGKTAVIQYQTVSLQVEQSNQFDRLLVYLLPDKLSSFMRVSGADGKYAEKLNELLKYKLVCVGFKGEQRFFYSQKEVVAKDYPGIVLTAIGKDDLDRELNKMANSTQFTGMQKENLFMKFDIKDQKRKKGNHELLELKEKLIVLIFPCVMDASNQYYDYESIPKNAK